MEDLPTVIIYTDGACDPNPGPGGWGVLLRYKDYESTLSGSEPHTTNNRMELTAAIQAIRSLNRNCRVILYTDSNYLKKGITEWMPAWKARHWRRKEGALANVELWQELDALLQSHQVEWQWVRAHAGNRYNQRVDRLARDAIPSGK